MTDIKLEKFSFDIMEDIVKTYGKSSILVPSTSISITINGERLEQSAEIIDSLKKLIDFNFEVKIAHPDILFFKVLHLTYTYKKWIKRKDNPVIDIKSALCEKNLDKINELFEALHNFNTVTEIHKNANALLYAGLDLFKFYKDLFECPL